MTTPDRWLRLGFDLWSLGAEAAVVMQLRALKLAGCDAAALIEAQRMVLEKADAALALQLKAATGGLGTDGVRAASGAVAHYRKKVRANRRRLTKRR